MSSSTSVTVVMASYNGERYIRQQIDSLLAQKGVDVQILVRDDGSKDSTTAILDEFKSKNALKWYTGKHLNVAYGFLSLLKYASRTDYYAFCDQDDVWKENKLAAAVEMLRKEDNSIPLLYYSATDLVDAELKLITIHEIKTNRSPLGRFFFPDISGNTIVINNRLRDLLVTDIPKGIAIHDKWAVQLCLATGGKCVGDPVSHILYRQHGRNVVGMETTLIQKACKFYRVAMKGEDIHLRLLAQNYGNLLVEPYKKYILMNEKEHLSYREKMELLKDKELNIGNAFFKLAFCIHVMKGKI